MNESEQPFRHDKRRPDQLRPVYFQNDIAPHALGSTLIQWGNTKIICAASVDESIPRWKKEQGIPGGWLTAEYSMLPYSTHQRKTREISRGRIEGRSQEIQRLIGRSLRTCVDLEKIGQRTVWVDCDVLQADGGTRTASITGAYVAIAIAFQKMLSDKLLEENPIISNIAGVSVGIVDKEPLLDLCYAEDSTAEVDMNLVMNDKGQFIELQASGEQATFSSEELDALITLGKKGLDQLFKAQKTAITEAATSLEQ
ncbi:MAG: ribonuclease PH [Verrucomicrobia bacterium]|nr:ribonuclease PH [Verrucomicrobiota bacterium]MCF7707760.1 ribonuclease PH [Verrucomicrobiota bacterium]